MLRPGHELFSKPFPVAPQLEDTPAPDNFEKWHPGFGKTVPTFPIFDGYDQAQDEPGLVTSDGGFEETPDAERILGGINMKGPDYAAVARHGSFVMWGFHCPPARLTDAGRRLFLNACDYAVRHRGDVVQSLRLRPTRTDLEHAFTIYLAMYPEAQRLHALERAFAGEPIPAALVADTGQRLAWLGERLPFVHPLDDGANWATAYQLAVDPDCKALGIANHQPGFLDALAARLGKDAADPLATALLGRYVPGVAPADFAAWLAAHRAQLYFTEAGGWVWRVRGERAATPSLHATDAADADEPVTLHAETKGSTLVVTLRVREGWHVYSPKAKDGKPVAVTIAAGSAFAAAGAVDYGGGADGVLRGYVELKLPLRRVAPGSRLLIDVEYTVCDDQGCKPLRTVRLER